MTSLKLQSHLLHACDYHSIDISRFAVPLAEDPVQTERELKKFLQSFAEKREVSRIEAQDMVTLSCSSDQPKFQKQHLTVRVGLGLYSKELEAQLIGLAQGETRTIRVGETTVIVSVEKIVREILPELTDALAERCGIPGVQTAEDVRTWCRYQQYDRLLEDPADDAFSYLAGAAIQNSAFALDPEEQRQAEVILYAAMNENSRLAGKTFDTAPEETFVHAFGISKQQMREQLKVTAEYTLKSAVLGQTIRQLQDCDYQAYLQKNATALQRPVEEIRQQKPMMEYLINTYSEIYMDTLERYVFRKLKEIGEKKYRLGQTS